MKTVQIILFSLLPLIFTATININWSQKTSTSKTIPTLQLVVNPLVRRSSPIHDQVFSNLAALKAQYPRFQLWFPYPKLVVAALQPPTGNPQCSTGTDGQFINLSCYQGTISSFDFISYGTPVGFCGNFQRGSCDGTNATAIIKKKCLSQKSCSIKVTPDELGGDPCY